MQRVSPLDSLDAVSACNRTSDVRIHPSSEGRCSGCGAWTRCTTSYCVAPTARSTERVPANFYHG